MAIVFKTPPYYNTNITESVTVHMQLRRPSDQEVSEPMDFRYLPENKDPYGYNEKKRKIEDLFRRSGFTGVGGSLASLAMGRPKAVPHSTMAHMRKDHAGMYLRQTPPTMQHQTPVFNQSYQAAPHATGAMMTTQAHSAQLANSWANANPGISVDTVTINPSGSMSGHPNSSRQHQPNRASVYHHKLDHSGCENNALPQLSMRDLQCLDTGSQGNMMNPSESQLLFQQQHQRADLNPDAQNQMASQSQGLQNMWQGFGAVHTVPNNTSNYNGSVPADASQGLGSFPFLEGMAGEDFLKGLVGGTSFQCKQEPQVSAGQDGGSPLMQSQRESQGNTYTNLVPRPMSNGANMDLRRQDVGGGTQPLGNLQIPFGSSGGAPEVRYANLSDWVKSSPQSK